MRSLNRSIAGTASPVRSSTRMPCARRPRPRLRPHSFADRSAAVIVQPLVGRPARPRPPGATARRPARTPSTRSASAGPSSTSWEIQHARPRRSRARSAAARPRGGTGIEVGERFVEQQQLGLASAPRGRSPRARPVHASGRDRLSRAAPYRPPRAGRRPAPPRRRAAARWSAGSARRRDRRVSHGSCATQEADPPAHGPALRWSVSAERPHLAACGAAASPGSAEAHRLPRRWPRRRRRGAARQRQRTPARARRSRYAGCTSRSATARSA